MNFKKQEIFITEERSSYEDEERNLHCICGELKTKCPDGYAHTTGGAWWKYQFLINGGE